jgi:hypothetical protein
MVEAFMNAPADELVCSHSAAAAWRTIRRYKPDGECRLDAIDLALWFTGYGRLLHTDSATRPLHTSDTIRVLRGHGARVRTFWPWSAGLFPGVFRTLAQVPLSDVTFSRTTFARWCRIGRTAIIHHLTAYQLYRSHEPWTHCIVELLDGSTHAVYDGLSDDGLFRRDHGATHRDLLAFFGPKIMVTT